MELPAEFDLLRLPLQQDHRLRGRDVAQEPQEGLYRVLELRSVRVSVLRFDIYL